MFTGNPLPLITFHLVDGGGDFLSAGIEYGTDRQIGFIMLVGFRFQGADTHYGNAQAESQPFSRAHPHPERIETPRSPGYDNAVYRLKAGLGLAEEVSQVGQQFNGVILLTAPG